MAESYFFYDLETSGIDAREARIMQFAGQRTDSELQPIGDPVNLFIKLTPDVLPEPEAVLLTGITPQQAISDGLTEAEFLAYFYKAIVIPDTIFVGYNSVRFDDEFMRFLQYRNFYDAYEWHWRNGCSRWDLLDVVRMTRALRPDGIVWPSTPEGKPTNRLELLTKCNHLDHYKAHDALSDVYATIAVANMIRTAQPKLFAHLLKVRKKDEIKQIVTSNQPFMYTSSHFYGSPLHTTAAVLLAVHAQTDSAIVYDLRVDPTEFLSMSVDELVERWRYSKDASTTRLPVKTIKYNRCPAVVPGVIHDTASLERLNLSLEVIAANLALLEKHKAAFARNVLLAATKLDEAQAKAQEKRSDSQSVDGRLYEGFYDAHDKNLLGAIRAAAPDELTAYIPRVHDERFRELLPLYKARNFPSSLNSEERLAWDEYRAQTLVEGNQQSRLAQYFERLAKLGSDTSLSDDQRYLLEELTLYGESIVPADLND
jgi:exodeoxyribonuclease-1